VKRRARPPTPAPASPRVPELVLAPQLAAILLLECALDIAAQALLAEHPTLIDDYARARDRDPAVSLAHVICRRAGALEDTLRGYRRAVRAAYDAATAPDTNDDDIPF
jgi:hypothetical protein